MIQCEVPLRELPWNSESLSPLFVYHLHQFDWSRHPALSARFRAASLLDWIDRHPSGEGWDPHPISLRTLSWGKLLLTPESLALTADEEARVLRSLASQVETLHRNLEVRLQANHLLSNLIGVVFGGILLEGPRADRWRAREAELRRALMDQFATDGLHVERSPMYHALLLENLLDLLNLARVSPRAPGPLVVELVETISRMLDALRVVCHPDGQIALFADSAFGIAQPPELLERYAAHLGISPRRPSQRRSLPRAGFTKLEAGGICAIVSHAGPQPAYQPGHAHCDALAFELSVAGQRVVTDTGVAEYLPGVRRDLARTTASHATLQIDGREQAELWAAHRIGGRPKVSLVEPPADSGRRLLARCQGFANPHTTHERCFEVEEQQLVIRDRVLGPTRSLRLPLPLAPGLEPERVPGGAVSFRIPLRAPGEERSVLITLSPALDWKVERGPYFPCFGVEIERAVLVVESQELRDSEMRFQLE